MASRMALSGGLNGFPSAVRRARAARPGCRSGISLVSIARSILRRSRSSSRGVEDAISPADLRTTRERRFDSAADDFFLIVPLLLPRREAGADDPGRVLVSVRA